MKNFFLLQMVLFAICFSLSNQLLAQSHSIKILEPQTDALLQAISQSSDGRLWLSGHKGSYGYSDDNGNTWKMAQVPGGESLEFRDVHALSNTEVLLMSAGEGEKSQLWRSQDAGLNWRQVFLMDNPKGFLDCMSFWDNERGLVFGDSFDGQSYVLMTEDAGQSWKRVDPEKLPQPALEEGGFAASGTCVCTDDKGGAYIGTSADPARLLVTQDFGETWSATVSPMGEGEFSGITSVVATDQVLWIFGGNLSDRGTVQRTAWFTRTKGNTWEQAAASGLVGAVYGGAVRGTVIMQVGPGGISLSLDGGQNFEVLTQLAFWSVAIIDETKAIAVGPSGRIALIEFTF
jgi:photosystem II stability/assembly factor-like uncharacterized protein